MTPGINVVGKAMTYKELLSCFEPRPIESEEHYWATQAIIDVLLAKATLSPDEQTYLHLLSLLIETYDEQQATVPELVGVELLRALIEESGLKQRDLLSIFKHESVLSDILNRRRKLTVSHISQLATFFRLPHKLFFERAEELPVKKAQVAIFNPEASLPFAERVG